MNKKIYSLLVLCILAGVVVVSLPLKSASAQYEIKELTPELKEALDSRKSRLSQLKSYRQQGVVGENNRGYVEALSGADEQAKELVSAENKDRKLIYAAIAEQNNLKNAMGTIEKVFAQEQQSRAAAGDKIQNESGEWVTK